MGWTTWVMIGLVVLCFWFYKAPDKAHDFTEPVFGKIDESLGSFNLFGNGTADGEEDSNICGDTVNPVCGSDGITYDNACKAALEGIMEVTQGACE